MLGAAEYLVFIPNNIVTLGKEGPPYPYVWTMFTSIFIEENFFFLVLYLALANYVVN
jgi:hypothetical protein